MSKRYRTILGAVSGSGGIDSDAQAYINAYNALSGAALPLVSETAINRFVKNMKGLGPDQTTYDWWTNAITILPFRGVTSARQALRLDNPSSPTSFGGGVTHTTTGVNGNGINGYYNFFDSSLASTDDVSVWVYKQTNQATDRWDFGARNNFTSASIRLRNRTAGGNLQANGFSVNLHQVPNSVSNGAGFTGISKHTAVGFDVYYRGILTTRVFDTFVNPNLIVMGLTENTSFSPAGYDNNTHSLAMALRGIPTSTEAAALKNVVDIFMTDLGINVP